MLQSLLKRLISNHSTLLIVISCTNILLFFVHRSLSPCLLTCLLWWSITLGTLVACATILHRRLTMRTTDINHRWSKNLHSLVLEILCELEKFSVEDSQITKGVSAQRQISHIPRMGLGSLMKSPLFQHQTFTDRKWAATNSLRLLSLFVERLWRGAPIKRF